MLGGAHVLLNFVELGRVDDLVGIFLGIDRLRFQRGVHLGHRHRNGIRSQRVEEIGVDRVLHGPDLEALDILSLGDRTLAVGHIAESVFPVTETDQVLVAQLVEELLSDRPVEDRVRLFLVFEQVREIEQRVLLDDAHERRGGHQRHLLHTTLSCGDRLRFAAELTVGIGFHLHLAAALLIDDLSELGRPQPIGVILGQDVAELDISILHVRRLSGRARQQERGDHQAQQQVLHRLIHRYSPHLVRNWRRVVHTLRGFSARPHPLFVMCTSAAPETGEAGCRPGRLMAITSAAVRPNVLSQYGAPGKTDQVVRL